ncbi:Hypothetical_protein [Hexamita inflata]|uniref:Hypothetical_protein n=1 Tax=Hexamita inflata TaxID=28002 RepID=A0AA86NA56_9EUKA|nr:Hypothetical protein HINF_LOCUS3517 [Hexamita inflata]
MTSTFMETLQLDETLTIRYKQGYNHCENNLSQYQDRYFPIIYIYGNHEQFDLCRAYQISRIISVNQCYIDLSHVDLDQSNVSLINCKLVGQATSHLVVNSLMIQSCNFKISQLQHGQINNIRIENYNPHDTLDLTGAKLLTKTHLVNLQLTKQTVDLSKLEGTWDYICFRDCTFKGQLRKDVLETKLMHIYTNPNIESGFSENLFHEAIVHQFRYHSSDVATRSFSSL